MEAIKEKITTGIKSNCLATKLNLIQELREEMNKTVVTVQNGNCFIKKTVLRDGIKRIVNSVN